MKAINIAIPTAAEAAALLSKYGQDALVTEAVRVAARYHTLDPTTVAQALPKWRRYEDLTAKQLAAVLAHFVSPVSRQPTCRICTGSLMWDGRGWQHAKPQPGHKAMPQRAPRNGER